MKVEVAVLSSPSLISFMVSLDVRRLKKIVRDRITFKSMASHYVAH